MAKEQPLGPQTGAPPSLEQIPIDRLNVDPAYQRATDSSASARIIFSMYKCWDWTLCQPLVVSRRADGSLYVLDGQHRLAGARRRGDILYLPCVVLAGIGISDEAKTFVSLNQERQRLSQADIFHGMLAAGDEHAKIALTIIEETRWRVVKGRNTATRAAGELDCAPMITRQVKAGGADAVRFALSILKSAYPDTPVRPAATMLKALFFVFENLIEDGLNSSKLVKALTGHDPDSWILRGQIQRERTPTLSGTAALARVMVNAAVGKPDTPGSIEIIRREICTAAPVIVAAAAKPGSKSPATFGVSGKGWCNQCEQLADRARAAACRDTHCSMKSAL